VKRQRSTRQAPARRELQALSAELQALRVDMGRLLAKEVSAALRKDLRAEVRAALTQQEAQSSLLARINGQWPLPTLHGWPISPDFAQCSCARWCPGRRRTARPTAITTVARRWPKWRPACPPTAAPVCWWWWTAHRAALVAGRVTPPCPGCCRPCPRPSCTCCWTTTPATKKKPWPMPGLLASPAIRLGLFMGAWGRPMTVLKPPKPFHQLPELVQLMQSRGMQVADVARAQRKLAQVGYDRLIGCQFP